MGVANVGGRDKQTWIAREIRSVKVVTQDRRKIALVKVTRESRNVRAGFLEDFDSIGPVLDVIDIKAYTADLLDTHGLWRVRRDEIRLAAKLQTDELSRKARSEDWRLRKERRPRIHDVLTGTIEEIGHPDVWLRDNDDAMDAVGRIDGFLDAQLVAAGPVIILRLRCERRGIDARRDVCDRELDELRGSAGRRGRPRGKREHDGDEDNGG